MICAAPLLIQDGPSSYRRRVTTRQKFFPYLERLRQPCRRRRRSPLQYQFPLGRVAQHGRASKPHRAALPQTKGPVFLRSAPAPLPLRDSRRCLVVAHRLVFRRGAGLVPQVDGLLDALLVPPRGVKCGQRGETLEKRTCMWDGAGGRAGGRTDGCEEGGGWGVAATWLISSL